VYREVVFRIVFLIEITKLTPGVFLHFTDVEQPKTAGVILLGTGGQAPPHTTTFFETACEMEDPRTIHPIAFRVHTHGLGKFLLIGAQL
jgi:peptidylglycine monooxygenase